MSRWSLRRVRVGGRGSPTVDARRGEMASHRRGVRPSQWPVRDLLGPDNAAGRLWDARVGAAPAGLLACGAAVTVVLTSGDRAVSDHRLEALGPGPLAIPAPALRSGSSAGPQVPALQVPPPAIALPQLARRRRAMVSPRRPSCPRITPPRSARPPHRRRRGCARGRRGAARPGRRSRRSRNRSPAPSNIGKIGPHGTARMSDGSGCRLSDRPTRPRCWIWPARTRTGVKGDGPADGTGLRTARPSTTSPGTITPIGTMTIGTTASMTVPSTSRSTTTTGPGGRGSRRLTTTTGPNGRGSRRTGIRTRTTVTGPARTGTSGTTRSTRTPSSDRDDAEERDDDAGEDGAEGVADSE